MWKTPAPRAGVCSAGAAVAPLPAATRPGRLLQELSASPHFVVNPIGRRPESAGLIPGGTRRSPPIDGHHVEGKPPFVPRLARGGRGELREPAPVSIVEHRLLLATAPNACDPRPEAGGLRSDVERRRVRHKPGLEPAKLRPRIH